MAGRHHVLLIGIDAYDGGGMLTGCVNDIDVVQRFLVDRVGVPRAHIRRLAAPRTGAPHETDVPEELPTARHDAGGAGRASAPMRWVPRTGSSSTTPGTARSASSSDGGRPALCARGAAA